MVLSSVWIRLRSQGARSTENFPVNGNIAYGSSGFFGESCRMMTTGKSDSSRTLFSRCLGSAYFCTSSGEIVSPGISTLHTEPVTSPHLERGSASRTTIRFPSENQSAGILLANAHCVDTLCSFLKWPWAVVFRVLTCIRLAAKVKGYLSLGCGSSPDSFGAGFSPRRIRESHIGGISCRYFGSPASGSLRSYPCSMALTIVRCRSHETHATSAKMANRMDASAQFTPHPFHAAGIPSRRFPRRHRSLRAASCTGARSIRPWGTCARPMRP